MFGCVYKYYKITRYKNQYEHTAHTLYLFLLGVWIYDSLPNAKKSIDNSINEDAHLRVKRFLFQWTYASLLHDIGYIFNHIVVESKVHIDEQGLRQYDRMFELEWIRQHIIGDLTPEYESILDGLCGEFRKNYKRWNLVDEPTPEIIIKKLCDVNWVNDFLMVQEKKKDAFSWLALESFDPTGERLRNEAMRIASEGYHFSEKKDSETKVDHAVASGLMLFQYKAHGAECSCRYHIHFRCDTCYSFFFNHRYQFLSGYHYSLAFFNSFVNLLVSFFYCHLRNTPPHFCALLRQNANLFQTQKRFAKLCTSYLSEVKLLLELAPCFYVKQSWLPGFTGPVPPPLRIRALLFCYYMLCSLSIRVIDCQ